MIGGSPRDWAACWVLCATAIGETTSGMFLIRCR